MILNGYDVIELINERNQMRFIDILTHTYRFQYCKSMDNWLKIKRGSHALVKIESVDSVYVTNMIPNNKHYKVFFSFNNY